MGDILTLLEHCRVPPSGAEVVSGKSLPLTFLDILCLPIHPIHRLLFYEFPNSTTYFTQTIVPNLKNSLSITLKHFLPLAGNLIFPSIGKPEIRYVDGDSVSLTFAISAIDFIYLTTNQPRNADDFYPLVPQLPPVTNESDSTVAPLLAVQVTLFPNYGICIGVTNSHVIGDASTMFNFMRAWASITKHGGDAVFLAGGSIPFYDRTVIKDPKGLDTIYLSQLGKMNSQPQLLLLTNKVRATFVMGRADIQRLKKLVSAQRPSLVHVSSFTVVCAYVWTCLVKLGSEEVDEEEVEVFSCVADCRARLNPPIPSNYLGNCIAPCIATASGIQLATEKGFLTATELIREAIRERVDNKEGVLKGAEMWMLELKTIMKGKRMFSIAGSPKFNFYDIDFGWGKPKKFEAVSIDYDGSMSLTGCRDSEGDLEIGLSFHKSEMDTFASIFAKGLEINP